MSWLARRRARESVLRIAPPRSIVAPPDEPFRYPEPYASVLLQKGSEALRAQGGGCDRWLADTAQRAYSAAGTRVSEDAQPLCRYRV